MLKISKAILFGLAVTFPTAFTCAGPPPGGGFYWSMDPTTQLNVDNLNLNLETNLGGTFELWNYNPVVPDVVQIHPVYDYGVNSPPPRAQLRRPSQDTYTQPSSNESSTSSEVSTTRLSFPSRVTVGQPFAVSTTVTNNTWRQVDVRLHLAQTGSASIQLEAPSKNVSLRPRRINGCQLDGDINFTRPIRVQFDRPCAVRRLKCPRMKAADDANAACGPTPRTAF